MSPGEEQYTPPDSTIISEDTTVVDEKFNPSIGKQHKPYHLLFHNDSNNNARND